MDNLFSDPLGLLATIIPDTVFRPRILIALSIVSILILSILKNTAAKKSALLLLSIAFLVLVSHPYCAVVFTAIVFCIYMVSTHLRTGKNYIFILLLLCMAATPYLFYYVLHINTLLYSFIAYYSVYRLIHYYLEAKAGRTAQYRLLDFLFYILYFPCVCHGPIERINALFSAHDSLGPAVRLTENSDGAD